MKQERPANGIKHIDLINHPAELKPDAGQLTVRKENILAAMGMELAQADTYLLDLIDEYTERCLEITHPLAGFVLVDHPLFDKEKQVVILDGIELNLGKMVTSYLRNSSYMAVFVATCGEEVEKLSKKLFGEGHTLEGYIVDLAGSELAEETADFVHRHIEKMVAKEGLLVTNRYSPGYCNWPVSDQHQLFSVLKENTCGISLTPSSLMIPVKSVSGILGIGEKVKRVAYKCKLCSDDKCILREKVYKKTD
jgi:hypothetical protein